METFDWLLVGHLVSDWILQNDWMARGKRKKLLTLAGATHVAIYTATTSGALWLSEAVDGRPGYHLAAATVLAVSHWLVDATDLVEGWMRFFRQSRLESVRLMVDQVLHVLVLSMLAAILANV